MDLIPGPDQLLAAAGNLARALRDGGLALGTWQGLYLWEHRKTPHSRHITLHCIGE